MFSETPVTFSLAVENANEEAVLLDGMVRRSKSSVKPNQPKYMMYSLVDRESVVVFLDPDVRTQGVLSILGKLVEYDKYITTSNLSTLYPNSYSPDTL